MSKYIDADRLKNGIMQYADKYGEISCGVTAFNILLERFAADVQEVKHGRWTQHDDAYYAGGGYWECSCCKWHISNFIFIEDARYCPNCGAKMDEVGE